MFANHPKSPWPPVTFSITDIKKLLKNPPVPNILSKYCGANHNTLIGTVDSGLSTNPCSTAVVRRLCSTRAAVTMVVKDKNTPVPIRWSMVMPEGFLVRDCAVGTKMRS
ncbi:methionyl-tRNA formyltransferase, partial [Striga asiatica]